jgi:hypothetical protein
MAAKPRKTGKILQNADFLMFVEITYNPFTSILWNNLGGYA